MKAIIIAAGPGTRLRPLTADLPKGMLTIHGQPLIERAIELYRAHGIPDISIIRGYKREKINFPNITYFENTDFWNNNILHSLMYARAKLEEALHVGEELVISYSDIWYTEGILTALIKDAHDIAAIVDTDWQKRYDGRTEHPISEAENVILDEEKKILQIGKHLSTLHLPRQKQGEFIGLWKFTPRGTEVFLGHFDRLDALLKKTDPYQHAQEWQRSYIADIFQDMIGQGEKIYGVLIQKNWQEFDTVQDVQRAMQMQ